MKTIFTSLLLFIALYAGSQKIFPGKDTSLISSKQLRVSPIQQELQKYGYQGFFKDENLKKKYECCDGVDSKYASLVNKTFQVTGIIPYKDIVNKEKYKIKLNNPQTGNLYFDYDPTYEHKWYFEFAGDFKLPEDFYCRGIEVKGDKFTGDSTFTTPAASGFSFIKVKKGKNTTIYMNKNEPGSTLNVRKKGAILLLDNDKRIEKPNVDLDGR